MLSHALQDCRLLTCEILGSQLKLWKSGTRWSFWFIFHHFRIQCIFVFCIVFCTLVCLCPWSQLNYSFWFEIPFAVVTTFIWREQQYGCRFLPQISCCPRYYRCFKSLSPKHLPLQWMRQWTMVNVKIIIPNASHRWTLFTSRSNTSKSWRWRSKSGGLKSIHQISIYSFQRFQCVCFLLVKWHRSCFYGLWRSILLFLWRSVEP